MGWRLRGESLKDKRETVSKTYTLTNSFHGTTAGVRPVLVTSGRFTGLYRISHKTVLRLRRALCGFATCQCGGELGQRENLPFDIVNEDSLRNLIVMRRD